jgi:hypothetical protein
VLGPSDIEVLPLGSTVDLTVSAGPQAAAFTLRALSPRFFRPAKRRTILASAVANAAGIATITLVDARGHRIASWQRPLHPGVNKVRLRMSTKTRKQLIHRPGLYLLTWTALATSSNDHANDRRRVLVVPAKPHR